MALRDLLLVSPLSGPAGGIQTWTAVVTRRLAQDPGISVLHVDSGVHWRPQGDTTWSKRLVGGTVQALRDAWRATRAIRARRLSCVHINTSASLASPKDWLIIQAARRAGVRCVLQFHVGFIPKLAQVKGTHWRWVERNARLADTVLVLGDHTARLLAKCLPETDIRSIPNPVEVPHQAPAPPGQWAGPARFLFLGQVREGKGIYELAKACSRLHPGAFNLRMIGSVSGAVRQRLTQLAGPEGVRWLRIMGEMPREACQQELLRSDALVLPSTGEFEAFPYVVLEAMAAARLVVTSSRGALPEILAANCEDPCGLLVPPGDVAALAGALQKVIDHPEESAQLGLRGFNRALSLYEASRVIDRLCGVWFPA